MMVTHLVYCTVYIALQKKNTINKNSLLVYFLNEKKLNTKNDTFQSECGQFLP